MYHYCTITTTDHLYKVRALYDSIRAIHPDACLHVLCIDHADSLPALEQVEYYSPADLGQLPSAVAVLSRYTSSRDKLRWCIKPLFLRYLLENKTDRVIYTDNDIYFHGDYAFLFELLAEHSFLLTPHHYPRDPGHDQNWLEANFKVGLYNAGFVGVNKAAIAGLEWWAACCAYRCEKNPLRGTFDDQKYLDLIPIIDEKACIVRHKGCNIAEWNRAVIARSEKDGRVMLDGIYPLIFVHYNGTTVRAILSGSEPCLRNSFDSYFANLKKYKAELKPESLRNTESLMSRLKYHIWKLATDSGF